MDTQKRVWADVYVNNDGFRIKLESKSLFFIPAALMRCNRNNISTSDLEFASKHHNKGGHQDLPGKQAIESVYWCNRPVRYDSALKVLKLFNLELPSSDQLTTADIVACVFRLREPDKIAGELGISALDIATGSGVSLDVAAAALLRRRLTYNDAHAIWLFLLKLKKDHNDWPVDLEEILTSQEDNMVKTDDRQPIAIEQVVRDGVTRYVYDRDNNNIRPAPRRGHSWALDILDR